MQRVYIRILCEAKLPFHARFAQARQFNTGTAAWNNQDEGGNSNEAEHKLQLHLAKPSKKFSVKKKSKAYKKELSEFGGKVLSEIENVAHGVSAGGGPATRQVRSELLNKLRQANSATAATTKTTISDIFAGMKVDAEQQRHGKKQDKNAFQQKEGLFENASEKTEFVRRIRADWSKDAGEDAEKVRPDVARISPSDIPNLFDGKPLGLFQHVASKTGKTDDAPPGVTASVWEELEKSDLQMLVAEPPRNGFEEMIQWTKEGKLWPFPIDNELGMEEEAKRNFADHIFLEPLIEDFPKRGPVRHFMELVVVGLAKNPWLSVQEKKDHIDWFREYFQGKQEMLESLIEEKKQVENQTG